MKKALIITAAVLLTILIGAGAYIASIDWTRYREDIAMQISKMSGKKLSFDGPFEFTMYPSPYMVAQDVKIYNPASESEKPIATIKKMVVDLSLMPLLQGVIDIRHMSFIEPQIEVLVLEDGKLNWQSDFNQEQIAQIRNTEVMLNSLTLEKGELSFSDEEAGIYWKLNNLNAEIIAQNLLGPYRIEGSYLRSGNPEGFAVSLGQFTENFATSLNLVLTHPQSDSYLRFDGSFLLSNRSINGNLVLESKNVKRLAEHNLNGFTLNEAYNYPLSISTGVNANKTQIDLSGFTLKYGSTAGAGNILLPLAEESYNYGEKQISKKQLETAFNFTNLDLEPLAYALKEFIQTYKSPENKLYLPEDFNVIGDVRSVNATYNGQDVKDLSFSFDYTNKLLHVNNLAAALPGDTSFDLKGDFYAEDGVPFYDFETSFNSGDLTEALSWLDIKPQISNAGVLRRSNGSAKISGTNKKLSVSPFKVTLDKSSLSGEYGIKFGNRNDSLLVLSADMINFDNYISAMPKEEAEQGLANRLQYRFAQLGALNDFEMQADIRLDLGIFEGLPLENVELKATLVDGILDISKLKIANAANMSVEALGNVKGFGEKSAFENLRYNIITEDLPAWLNKMEATLPEVNLKQVHNFDSEGIITGDLNRMAMKSNTQLGDLKLNFGGQLSNGKGGWQVNGQVKAEHPDFVEMLHDFNINYNPQNYILGRFVLNGKAVGSRQAFKLSDMKANIGVNEFKGDLVYENTDNRPSIVTDLEISSFEWEKFIYNTSKEKTPPFAVTNGETANLWQQPKWPAGKIDYSFYQSFDLSAALKVKKFSAGGRELTGASANLKINNGVLNLSDLTGQIWGGMLQGDMELNMNAPALSAKGKLENADAALMELSGGLYGPKKGILSLQGQVNSSAVSPAEFLGKLSGELNVSLNNVLLKGWNLPAVYTDLQKRDVSEGLGVLVRDSLSSGEMEVDEIKFPLSFNQGSFSFNNLQMNAGSMAVSASGTGSLPEWNLNSRWNVRYDGLNGLPGFGFGFNGSLSSPEADIDVAALTGLYDARQRKIEEEKQAREDEKRAKLKEQIDNQQQVGTALKDELSRLTDLLENKRKLSSNQLMLDRFSELHSAAQASETEIADILIMGSSDNVNENLLNDLARRNETATQNLEKLKRNLFQAFLDDAKLRSKEQHDRFVEVYNAYKSNKFNFNAENERLMQDLKLIETQYALDKDEEAIKMLAEIEKFEQDAEAFNGLLEQKYAAQQNSTDADEWEAYYVEMAPQNQAALDNLKAAEDALQKYLEYASAKTENEKTVYNNKIREEEVKKKLEKNTGVISIKKTGKNVVVTRDIDEIEKAEEMKANEDVPILDFSRKPSKNNISKTEDTDGKVVKAKRKIR